MLSVGRLGVGSRGSNNKKEHSMKEEPKMNISVTGDSNEIITWCGQTWKLPEQSGEVRTVTPTLYKGAIL